MPTPNAFINRTRAIAISYAIAFLGGGPALAEDLSFVIHNNNSADLVEFNVTTVNSQRWEDNLMSGGYLAPGYEIDVLIADGLTVCTYDIRGVFDDGSVVEDFDLDLCDIGSYTFTD